jgi:Predicted glycosyltransferases
MYDFTASIVTYNTPTTDLEKIIKCFQKIKLNFKLWISDNSETDALRNFFEKINDDRIEYIFNNANKGFGEGHNRIIKKVAGDPKLSEFHLAINADIYFKENTIEKIVEYMKEHEEIGQIGPKITDLEGEFSYTCRLFPTPMNLILRRFLPFKKIVDKMDYDYEMRWANFEEIMEVPILSGCFIFSRTAVLKEIGGFDKRYFMYMEDYDLCRKIGQKYKVVYYPEVNISHEHGKASYKSKKMMMFHIKSAIKYFNKWGWFFDKERKIKNDETRRRYQNLGGK